MRLAGRMRYASPTRGPRVTVISVCICLLGLWLAPGPASAATPTVTEFGNGITPNSPIFEGITAGSDGRIWFANWLQNKLDVINPANPAAITEVAVGSGPFGVTSGPDGNIYYAMEPGNGIGSMIPATGVHSEQYFGGGNSADPHFVATGPNGEIWDTEPVTQGLPDTDNISHTTPATPPTTPGIQGSFPVTGDANPEVITVGPSDSGANPTGALWFTEQGTNKIGRLSPVDDGMGGFTALISEYIGLGAGAQPTGIAAGPDGSLWFTEPGINKVGKLTPAATFAGAPTIVEFPLPAGATPLGIAAGPDGNLWIAEFGSDKIARMTTAGVVIGEFPVPTGSPRHITAGPDGNLWFTEFLADVVGRITTGLDQPAFSNSAQIAVPTTGTASPYPSSINVSGLQGTVTDVTVRLTGISHSFPDDMDILLQGPQGQNVMLASDVGSPAGTTTSYPAEGITLNFNDGASFSLPDSSALVSGFYKPTNRAPAESQTELSAPAPPPPYGSALSAFDGTDGNGTWKLFVIDDALHTQRNLGTIFGGWGLDIATTGPPVQTPPVTPQATPTTTPTTPTTPPTKKCKKKKHRAAAAKKKCKKKK
jgi:YVTN family beta-propeller protein